MAQQLLHNLHVLAIGMQQSRIGVPKRVPTDPLSDPCTLGRRLNVVITFDSQTGCFPRFLPARGASVAKT